MNPWAGLVVAVAVILFIVSYKNTQDNLIAAMLGRQYGNSTLYATTTAAAPTGAAAIPGSGTGAPLPLPGTPFGGKQ